MSIKTRIPWTDSTCNPTMGCTGCELYPGHCYAARMCKHYAARKGWPAEFTKPEYFKGRIEKALGWRDLTGTKRPDKPWLDDLPRIIFIDDMGDGFCPDVDPEIWLSPHLSAMADSRHIWLLLTKWPHQMRTFFFPVEAPRNFWLGTSVLRWQDIWRLDELLNIPASIHFVNIEPMLSMITLSPYLRDGMAEDNHPKFTRTAGKLNTVFAGCESGPNRRHTDIDWLRDLRDQCQKASTPFFLKQRDIGGTLTHMPQLDGRIWSEMPNITPAMKGELF